MSRLIMVYNHCVFVCMPTERLHSSQAVSGSAWLLLAEMFPLTLFNTIFRFSFFCSSHGLSIIKH